MILVLQRTLLQVHKKKQKRIIHILLFSLLARHKPEQTAFFGVPLERVGMFQGSQKNAVKHAIKTKTDKSRKTRTDG